jgi:hypothetical protein
MEIRDNGDHSSLRCISQKTHCQLMVRKTILPGIQPGSGLMESLAQMQGLLHKLISQKRKLLLKCPQYPASNR